MNVKKINYKTPFFTLLIALLTAAVGIIVMMLSDDDLQLVIILAAAGLLLAFGTVRLFQSISSDKLLEGMISLSVCWGFAAVLVFLNTLFNAAIAFPSIIVGVVSLLLGIMRLLICVNCFMNHFAGGVRNGISAILCIGFGLLLVIRPIENFGLLSTVAGFYLIFYAVTMLGDAIAAFIQSDLSENRSRRRTHFAIPNLISALKPTQMIYQINEKRELGKLESGMLIEEKNQEHFDKVNLEVFIHLTTQGSNKFGHVDVSIDGNVYSYGTYNPDKVKFGGFVAGGSFIAVPKIPYLKYCLDVQKKYVIGFGACLSDVQLKTVRDKVSSFMSENCELIESKYERAVREGRDGSAYDDRMSVFARDMNGKTYDVVSGPFKKYFGININCVQFADWLLNESGIDSISFSGIRTPGAYYTMLENMFLRKNTRVIRKVTYIISDEIAEIGDISR